MTRLKTGATIIDTKKLGDEFRSLVDSTHAAATELARQSLQAQIDAINGATSNRESAARAAGIKTSGGTVDMPLSGAQVVISSRRGKRVIVYVKHKTKGSDPINLFSRLSRGRKPGTVKQGLFIFPSYSDHTIPQVVSGDPKRIVKNTGALDFATATDESKKVVMREGQRINGFAGAHFYEAAAKWVEEELLRRGIVSIHGRGKVKLKKGDIIVTASEEARFNE